MLHIKEQRHGINSQKDTECLNDSYFCQLNASLTTYADISRSYFCLLRSIVYNAH